MLDLLLGLVALLAPASAQDPDAQPPPQGASALRVGHWVEVKGALDTSGDFVADELELLPPEDKERLTGAVERVLDRERFLLLGQVVQISSKTEWKGLALGDLEGSRVRVEGRYRGPRKFSAREIAARGSGRDRIEGRIDRIEREGAWLRLWIMGFQVVVEAADELELALPLEQVPLAPPRVVNPQQMGGDEDDELPGRIRLADDLTLGGQLGLEARRKANYDLDDSRARDREDYEATLRLRLLWGPSPDFLAVLGTRVIGEWRRDEEDGDSDDSDLVINEAYLYWRDGLRDGWDLQLGRQDFDDEREWIYDQNLDALRLIRSSPSHRLELSLSTNLTEGSDYDQDTLNLIGYLSNNSSRRHAALWVVDRRDQDDLGTSATHVGGRLLGEWLPASESWLDVGAVTGEREGQDLSGVGFDLGTTWTPPSDLLPYLSVGYAWGGESFRQTGLQDDNDKLGGVTSFRYYGELVDPELANLSVLTLGVGRRIDRRTSLDLVAHKYDQVEAAPSLVRTDLRSKPDGVHRDLGWALELVVGSRAIPATHVEAVLGRFEPGDAFPGGDPAWVARLQLRFRF